MQHSEIRQEGPLSINRRHVENLGHVSLQTTDNDLLTKTVGCKRNFKRTASEQMHIRMKCINTCKVDIQKVDIKFAKLSLK